LIGLIPVIIGWFTERRGRIPGTFREGVAQLVYFPENENNT
jgi:hypothetical protein